MAPQSKSKINKNKNKKDIVKENMASTSKTTQSPIVKKKKAEKAGFEKLFGVVHKAPLVVQVFRFCTFITFDRCSFF